MIFSFVKAINTIFHGFFFGVGAYIGVLFISALFGVPIFT